MACFKPKIPVIKAPRAMILLSKNIRMEAFPDRSIRRDIINTPNKELAYTEQAKKSVGNFT